jgi:hypothetical protein
MGISLSELSAVSAMFQTKIRRPFPLLFVWQALEPCFFDPYIRFVARNFTQFGQSASRFQVNLEVAPGKLCWRRIC